MEESKKRSRGEKITDEEVPEGDCPFAYPEDAQKPPEANFYQRPKSTILRDLAQSLRLNIFFILK